MPTTDREARIADAVLDLVHRRADFDPLELLHDLTGQVVALLQVRCAGVTVLDRDTHEPVHVTASDELCLALEQEQSALGEGPCIDSARARQPLPVTPLTGPPGSVRWPRFAPYARRAGITAVAAVSLGLPQMALGGMNLMMTHPAGVSDQDLRLARTLADAAAVALAHQQQLIDKDTVLAQLQRALDSRLVIEQAKGVLSASLHLSMDEAFQRLRVHARSRQQKLTELAARIARGDVPAELLDPSQ
ncbi:transcriptional regulator [Streptomyces longispororuber]|uniref:Transcriptional regulator n=1 Tax=Streptomyces longispororuber TaxID=68230 RepID=A0A918ZV77_9ACTN|nr:ANTAR domain-containing protein [Streptomyces longispororuber]GHE69305.1 transcriptional regulator [Streptomyces longispororuber]